MSTLASNKFKELLLKKILDFQNDTFKIILMQKGFAFSRANHNTYADVAAEELANQFGYTSGGQALAGVVVTKDDVENAAYAQFNNVSWLVAGGNLETDGAIIFDDTVASPVADPVIGYIDFGGTVYTLDGGTHTVVDIIVAIG